MWVSGGREEEGQCGGRKGEKREWGGKEDHVLAFSRHLQRQRNAKGVHRSKDDGKTSDIWRESALDGGTTGSGAC